ncbi:MAG TPA: hypothetical protein VGI39_02070 [Polyangiaceae bacterium]
MKRKPGLLLAIAAGAAAVVACGGAETSHVTGSLPEPSPDGSVPDAGGCSPYDCCGNHLCGTAPVPPPDSGPVGVVIEPPSEDGGRPDAFPVGIVLPPPEDAGPDATIELDAGSDASDQADA